MKPKFIALNLMLIAGVAAIAYKGKESLDASQAKRRTTLNLPVKPAAIPPLSSAPVPEPAVAAKYVEVAQKDLFSKDRNPQIIIDPPKAPEAPPPMPKLPVVYGVMGLPSGIKAIMADQKGGASTVVRAGDQIGEFKIVALDTRQVTFGWKDKQVTKNIEDLLDRGAPADTAAAPAARAAASGSPAAPVNTGPPDPKKGVEIGDGNGPSVKSCPPGDNAPAGTIADGYKKILEATPFGNACRWVKQQ